jgi:hypothetical protein
MPKATSDLPSHASVYCACLVRYPQNATLKMVQDAMKANDIGDLEKVL